MRRPCAPVGGRSPPDEGPGQIKEHNAIQILANGCDTFVKQSGQYTTEEQHSGTAQWNSTVEQHSGTAQWNSTVEQHSGTAQWNSTVEQHSGTPQWNTTVEHHSGTPQWNSTVEHHSGTPQWNDNKVVAKNKNAHPPKAAK
ncbi:unnamed protein product, partial [Iphiclides podalirius]